MIDRVALLADLQKLLTRLEADLLQRSESTEVPAIGVHLRAEFERAKTAERTALNYEDWRSDAITQCAAAWVLSCVFVRFLEDNRLIDPPKIAGPGPQLQQARDEHELYFRQHPRETDRDYLLALFTDLGKLPGTKDVFGQHNPLNELPNWLSGDAAGESLRFFQKVDANTGSLVHDFTDPQWDTRFLGDLYQDLSEAARKKYALLQTPEFVEEFILDRTLEPALDEFGLEQELAPDEQKSLPGMDDKARLKGRFRMIDPACGSGHFLLGAFPRILGRWQHKEPGTKVRELVQRTLHSIHGVDVNPFAIAIARFRLLLAAMRASQITQLSDCPAFEMQLACGDSLYHGRQRQQMLGEGWSDEAHFFRSEDARLLRQILREGTYHCVVANPPYITPKDRAANEVYRDLYPKTCHMKYSLAVPFMERIFALAIRRLASGTPVNSAAGYTGQITTNSFMKREFGKKLIESFLPTVDLTQVIDTSGAYIPGCGTPTVILFGRNRLPLASTLRAVMGIKGEPSTPSDPGKGVVWSAIVDQIDRPGSNSEFVSVGDPQRELFHSHPWSIGGGGVAELKESLDAKGLALLGNIATSIGITSFTLADDVYFLPLHELRRRKIPQLNIREMVVGDSLRDWRNISCEFVIFPYDANFEPIPPDPTNPVLSSLWTARTVLSNNKMFGGKTKVECGLKWYEYGRLTSHKLRTPLSITFANVATHNHFVLDRGGRIFECHAPIIKLATEASEADHIAILGMLNNSTACFWMKQVFYPKATTTGDISTEKGRPEANRYEFAGTGLESFPLTGSLDSSKLESVGVIAGQIELAAQRLQATLPKSILQRLGPNDFERVRDILDQSQTVYAATHERMIALQEELDWEAYRAYDICPEGASNYIVADHTLGIPSEARPFLWQTDTAPESVPSAWRKTYEARRKLIRTIPELTVIENPVFKRPWWGRQGVYGRLSRDYKGWSEEAFTDWLLDRIESYFDFDGRMNATGRPTARLEISTTSVAKLADIARRDAEFLKVGEMYRDDAAFDVQALVAVLLEAESVPMLPVLRYKESGLRKRAEWEQTWALQRREDAGEQVGAIPVPPKYTSADFLKSDYWRLRGKLDIPKERWISFPHSPGSDGTLTIAWAGYDHLQQARAISAYYVDIQERLGGRDDERLPPLLACLLELLPWLKQWHNEPDPNFDGLRMGDYFESFITEQARTLPMKVPQEDGTTKTVSGWTIDQIKAWTPPTKSRARKTRAPKSTSSDAQ